MTHTFIKPMLAKPNVPVSLEDANYVYERKFDGIRGVVSASPQSVEIFARSGAQKTRGFPDIAEAVQDIAAQLNVSFVLDGEILAVNDDEIGTFQQLQHRVHVTKEKKLQAAVNSQRSAFMAFDILEFGTTSLADQPWATRRIALNDLAIAAGLTSDTGTVRVSKVEVGTATALWEQAQREGWEGLIAKRALSRYQVGKRSSDWVKLKFSTRQEFVIGGWTEPRLTRQHLGAIILGYYKDGRFIYCGKAGTGFTHSELDRVYGILSQLEIDESPFDTDVDHDSSAVSHWVKPLLMAEVKYAHLTDEGKLVWPVYLGLRDDKDPKSVVLEVA